MTTRWFIAFYSLGSWWVDCEGKSYGPFDSKDEARKGARRLAEVTSDPLRQSLAFAPNVDGRQELLWTGPDPAETSFSSNHRQSPHALVAVR